jgi:hypothetical protein
MGDFPQPLMDGLCGRLASGETYPTSNGREPRAVDAEWLKLRGQALLQRLPTHTRPPGRRAGEGALVNDGGESRLPAAAPSGLGRWCCCAVRPGDADL